MRPYLSGDCAFMLDKNMMKSASQSEVKANPILRIWDQIASQTRKPIECAFVILKQRFQSLKVCVKLLHEDEIAPFLMSSVILLNMSVGQEPDEEALLPQDEDGEQEEATVETADSKKQRDALLYYVTNTLNSSDVE